MGLVTVAYTAYGGIRASIFTDRIQFNLIMPLLAIGVIAVVVSLDGLGGALDPVSETAPQLLSLTHGAGIEFGVTLVIAILAANMFHQGFWQRVYTSEDDRALRRGFGIAAAVVIPTIIVAGLLGVAAAGRGVPVEEASSALFWLVIETTPTWIAIAFLLLALVLVMSSLDTLLNGIASAVTSDPRTLQA